MFDQSKLHRHSNVISRDQLLLYLSSALQLRSEKFGRQASLAWLSSYPGDLEVSFYLSKFFMAEGKNQQAGAILADICNRDPEFVDAQDALAIANAGQDNRVFERAISCAYALGKSVTDIELVPAWGTKLRTAIKLYRTGRHDESRRIIEEILGYNLDVPLPSIYHLYILSKNQDRKTLLDLAVQYHKKWPETLVFNYFVVQHLFEMGNDAEAVSLLHRSAANDPNGSIARRVWLQNNPYQNLWPVIRPVSFDIPLPSEIAALFGWNKIGLGDVSSGNTADVLTSESETPMEVIHAGAKEAIPEYFNSMVFDHLAIDESVPESGEKLKVNPPLPIHDDFSVDSVPKAGEADDWVDPKTEVLIQKDETIQSVEDAFGRMAKRLNQKGPLEADRRFPVYVIFSSKIGLKMTYGSQTFQEIDKELRALAEAVQANNQWGAMVYYPDDVDSNTELGLPVSEKIDPWQLKLALVDLDKYLEKKGAMIGALLIVGGDEIVPYHKLPNPTDDSDTEILSDNPYATIDSNYFVPEWPVGRFPTETGKDAGLLLSKIRQAISMHGSGKKKKPSDNFLLPIIRLLSNILQLIIFRPSGGRRSQGFGYTAAIWKKASLESYKTIGDEKTLLKSPPEYSGSFSGDRINYSDLGYFNLHGLVDGAEWFGQPDGSGSVTGVEYPVALKPKDLNKCGRSPEVVFTEACYGGHVHGKSEDNSIALRFLANGTKAVAGSTCISYGSIAAPMIGADLLAHLFWRNLTGGLKTGDAFLKAKVDFVREMNKRQSFLDGEDQKTLISFVLYGDPLSYYSGAASGSKGLTRSKTRDDVRMTMDDVDVLNDEQALDSEIIDKVRKHLESYLPGIHQSKMVISKQRYTTDDIRFEFDQMRGRKVSTSSGTGRTVLTLSKQVKSYNNVHQHYARATLDKNGKLVKLSVSR